MAKSTAKGQMAEQVPAEVSALPAEQDATIPVLAVQQTSPELEQQIRELAYQLYEQRGGQNGSAEQDWLQAEAIILGRKDKLAA